MTRHILVIDDAATVRLYHRKMLGDAGWHIDEAGNGLEALERVTGRGAEPPYELYVCDINMPKMDGYAFVRELRRLVSTEAQSQDSRAAQDAGANAYLVKPARPAELVLTAALLLGDAGAARRAAAQIAAATAGAH